MDRKEKDLRIQQLIAAPWMRRVRSTTLGALLALGSIRLVACARPEIPVSANPGIGVTLRRDITDYAVAGASVRELRLSIATRARLEPDRTAYGGFTTWKLGWRYTSSRSAPGGCRPNGVTVYLDLSVRYPAWEDSSAASAPVREEWNRYVTALKAHEGNHAAIAIRGANRLAAELKDLVSPICSGLQSDAQRLANNAINSIRTENNEYDENTRHGVTEGASLLDR